MADPTSSSSSGLNSIVMLKDSSVQDEKDHKEAAFIWPSLRHPYLSAVQRLVYWQEPKKSVLVFGGSMLVLTSLATFSVISVISYLLLALLCVTITFRVYKSIMQAVQKTDDGHPFKVLMERDISVSPDTARRYMDIFLVKLNTALVQTRRLVLVEDVVDSLKNTNEDIFDEVYDSSIDSNIINTFKVQKGTKDTVKTVDVMQWINLNLAVVMWFLTFVGAVFNGITILILADIVLFCTPLLYERNKTQIDGYLVRVQSQLEEELAKLQDKLPGPLKRRKAE